MSKLSAKTRILNFLKKDGPYNTLTVAQAQSRFGVQNVAARIEELRNEGHVIYTNRKTTADGRTINVYRMGTPSRKLVQSALAAGFTFRDAR